MNIKGYCEPFCGMLGVYQHIPNLLGKDLEYIASDLNKSTISMWEDCVNGWVPPTTTTEKEYNNLKSADDSALKGYIGHQYSFGGQFFNGYAPKYGKNIDSTRASNNVKRISKILNNINVNFLSGSYEQLSYLKNYIIYCDPPYNKTICRYKEKFDNDKFILWCREMQKHNIVIISEYSKPPDTKCIFTKDIRLVGRFGNGGNLCRQEKLFLF
jgi:site-specific DNA-adenine methylase